MVGNLTSVTTAPARTSAPSVPRADLVRSGAPEPTGKNVAASGGTLPPMPVIDVSRAVERLNELMSGKQRSLRFQVDAGSGRTVITVINESTKEVIRQIPSEELLAIARNLEALGSLIDAII
jgi:flagellar protein FlaG